MIKNTLCFSSLPITVQASLRVRKLALHSNRSYCYAFRSRAALTNTNPAPAIVILVRTAGWLWRYPGEDQHDQSADDQRGISYRNDQSYGFSKCPSAQRRVVTDV
ncbi:MAG: hypothetical protein WBO16_03465 [Gammaproteobacteria bacterium]